MKARYDWKRVRFQTKQDVGIARDLVLRDQHGEVLLFAGKDGEMVPKHPTRERVRQKRLDIFMGVMRLAAKVRRTEADRKVSDKIERAFRVFYSDEEAALNAAFGRGLERLGTGQRDERLRLRMRRDRDRALAVLGRRRLQARLKELKSVLRRQVRVGRSLTPSLNVLLNKARQTEQPSSWHQRTGTKLERLRELKTKNLTASQIAKRLSCGESYVIQTLRRLGKSFISVDNRFRTKYAWPDRRDPIWKVLTDREMAEKLGIWNPQLVTGRRIRKKIPKLKKRKSQRVLVGVG